MKCTIEIAAQLVSLPAQRGWLDGEGEAVSALTIMEARRVIDRDVPPDITPFLYPTAGGGVSIEWDEGDGGHITVDPIRPVLTWAEARRALAHLKGDDE